MSEASKIFVMSPDGTSMQEVDPGRTMPLSRLPAPAVRALLGNSPIGTTLLGWSPKAETFILAQFTTGMLCVFRRVYRMGFNVPFQVIERTLARVSGRPELFNDLPAEQRFVCVPDLESSSGVASNDTFLWEAPQDMALFFATCITSSAATMEAGLDSAVNYMAAVHNHQCDRPSSGASDTSAQGVYLMALDISQAAQDADRARWYRLPFPNVHDNASLCTGSPHLPFHYMDLEDSFSRAFRDWSTRPWNSDLATNTTIQNLTRLIRGDATTNKSLPPAIDWKSVSSVVGDPFVSANGMSLGAEFMLRYLRSRKKRRSEGKVW